MPVAFPRPGCGSARCRAAKRASGAPGGHVARRPCPRPPTRRRRRRWHGSRRSRRPPTGPATARDGHGPRRSAERTARPTNARSGSGCSQGCGGTEPTGTAEQHDHLRGVQDVAERRRPRPVRPPVTQRATAAVRSGAHLGGAGGEVLGPALYQGRVRPPGTSGTRPRPPRRRPWPRPGRRRRRAPGRGRRPRRPRRGPCRGPRPQGRWHVAPPTAGPNPTGRRHQWPGRPVPVPAMRATTLGTADARSASVPVRWVGATLTIPPVSAAAAASRGTNPTAGTVSASRNTSTSPLACTAPCQHAHALPVHPEAVRPRRRSRRPGGPGRHCRRTSRRRRRSAWDATAGQRPGRRADPAGGRPLADRHDDRHRRPRPAAGRPVSPGSRWTRPAASHPATQPAAIAAPIIALGFRRAPT